jgi:hypothetical protein
MSLPTSHGYITGGYYPLLHRQVLLTRTDIDFHDYYDEIYSRLELDRHELLAVFPSVLNVDVLAGTAMLQYLDEEKE